MGEATEEKRGKSTKIISDDKKGKRRLQRKKEQKERDGTRVPVSKVRDDRIKNLLLLWGKPHLHIDLENSKTQDVIISVYS